MEKHKAFDKGVHFWGPEDCLLTLEENLERRGVHKIGEGIARAAFAFNGCALKVAKTKWNTKDNFQEIGITNLVPRRIRRFVLGVTDADKDGYWLALPLAKTSPFDHPAEGDEELDEASHFRIKAFKSVINGLEKAGYRCHDLHTGNVGVVGRQSVVIDFGVGISSKRDPHREVCMIEQTSKPRLQSSSSEPPSLELLER